MSTDIPAVLTPGRSNDKKEKVQRTILDTVKGNPTITKLDLVKILMEKDGPTYSTAYRWIRETYTALKDSSSTKPLGTQ